MQSLTDKVVIVTGASDGIGAEVAAVLVRRGAKVSIAARSSELLLATQTRIDPAQQATLVAAGDLTLTGARSALIDLTLARWGRIDVLINNAGRGSYFSTLETPPDEARALFELNFFAPLALTQLAAPHIRATKGSIVNVSSIAGQIPLPWLPLYSASKFAMATITATLRMELAGDGVHVMGVFPGYVNTEFQHHAVGDRPPDNVVKGKRFAISVEGCAAAIVGGLERRRKMVVTPKSGWPLIWLYRLFPALVEAQMAGAGPQPK